MIIMIHVGYSYQLPILRVAVPVFFIISSFFFFQGITGIKNNEVKAFYIKFIKRAMKLYLFWFIILLPLTIKIRGWYQEDFMTLCGEVAKGLILQSTFPASWYISAYIIGISIIFVFRHYHKTIFLISLCAYILCCASSNYYYLFDCQLFKWGGVSIETSFLVGLVFICMGKHLASIQRPFINIAVLGTIFGIIMLIIENHIIVLYGFRRSDDSYLSLLVLAPCVFMLFNGVSQMTRYNTTNLRRMSTVYYCSHIPIIYLISYFISSEYKLSILLSVWLICTFLSFILINFSKLPGFKWVRFSY